MTIFIIITFILILSAGYAGYQGAPWVPTFRSDLKRFVNLAAIKPGDVFYDLGCGDGRLVEAAAKAGAVSYGFELSIFPYLMAKIRTARLKNAHIIFGNFFNQDLAKATIIYFFLMPKFYNKIYKKIMKDCRSGTRVIAYVWPFANWQPKHIDKPVNKSAFYLYTVNK